jgi:hypothetical protein
VAGCKFPPGSHTNSRTRSKPTWLGKRQIHGQHCSLASGDRSTRVLPPAELHAMPCQARDTCTPQGSSSKAKGRNPLLTVWLPLYWLLVRPPTNTKRKSRSQPAGLAVRCCCLC